MIKEMQEFLESKVLDENKSKVTVNNYSVWLEEFCSILKISSIEDFLSLKRKDLQEYIRFLNTRNQGSSVWAKSIAIRSFYSYMMDVDIESCPENIIRKVKMPNRSKKVKIAPTTTEVLSVLEELKNNKTYYLLTSFLSQTGLRISEALSIKVSDFYKSQVKVVGKGDKERTVFLSEDMMQLINDYIQNDRKEKRTLSEEEFLDRHLNTKFKSYSHYYERSIDANTNHYLFLSQHGVKMDASGIRKTLKKYAEKAGIDLDKLKFSPHRLRASFATEGMQHGVSLSSMQSFLGHAYPSTTMGYIGLNQEQKKESYQVVFDMWKQ